MLHYSKMEETTPTIEEKTPTIEEKTPKIEEKTAKIEETVAKTESAEEKKKGRPAGAKDKAPRKKKIVIVEEPIHVPVPREPRRKTEEPPEVPRAPVPAPEPEPPSPRTMYRAATRHVMHAQNQKIDARRTQIQQTYTQKLHTF